MCWLIKHFKNTLYAVGIMVSTALFCQCKDSDVPSKQAQETLFDLPTFFEEEIIQLTTDNKEIHKTVSTGTGHESKRVLIDDWSRELSAFLAIDLNKPVYQGYVEIDSSDRAVLFRVNNSDLDVAEVAVHYDGQNRPAEIYITRHIQNFLYTTQEKLSYQKGKGYKIEKQQDVWILGSNSYAIEGAFRE